MAQRFWLRIEEILEGILAALVGNFVRATVTFETADETVLFTVPAGRKAKWSLADVTEVWDGVGATFDVGWAADPDGVFDGLDLTTLGPTASGTPHSFTTETQIYVTVNHQASTTGEAEVVMELV